jgi:VWFA-related protein
MSWGLSKAGERGGAKAIAFPILFLVVLAGHAGDRAPQEQQDRDPGSFRISVDVRLVVLHATVTDRQGSGVSDLGEHDFAVYEDGVPQAIRLFKTEDIPVTVGLVVDHSTSMQLKLSEVTLAAMTFVRRSNRQDEMFVVNFNERVSLGLPGTMRFTDSATELEHAIVRVQTGGQTALYDAIAKALAELQAGTREKKVLIVVSDGGDNASKQRLGEVMKLAEQSNAVIYTVGLFDATDPDRNPGVLRRLARETGGEAYVPGELSEVVGICEGIARDIRHQYTIGYVPSHAARDGAYHTIRVVAGTSNHDKLSVRTRTGYIASAEPGLDEKGAR